MSTYYTQSGQKIRNPDAYARTGAPMYTTKYTESKDINAPTVIYKMNLKGGKKYVGKTTDVDRRMDQHFSGNGAKVTKKSNPDISTFSIYNINVYYICLVIVNRRQRRKEEERKIVLMLL